MRLLLVTKDFPPDIGGIQTYCYELGKCFARDCESFAVVAPDVPGSETADHTLPFEVVRIPGTRSSFAPSLLAALPWLKSRYAFEAVLGAQWQAAWAALAARRALGPYAVCAAVHGREVLTKHYARWGGSIAYDSVRRYTLGNVDRLFPGSRYALSLVREKNIPFKSAEIATYGCDPARFASPRHGAGKRRELGLEGKRVLMSLCRLVPRKGVDTVIQAMPAISAALPDACYVVAGDGEDRSRLQGLVAELGVSRFVQFLGRVRDDEVPALLDMADVFVMPAREERPCVEGFGLVFLEAAACGKPVIGSTSGGIPDAVIDGTTGILVPPGAPGPLSVAAIRLLTDPELRSSLGARGQERVLHEVTWERLGAQLQASISQLVGSGTLRGAALGLARQ